MARRERLFANPVVSVSNPRMRARASRKTEPPWLSECGLARELRLPRGQSSVLRAARAPSLCSQSSVSVQPEPCLPRSRSSILWGAARQGIVWIAQAQGRSGTPGGRAPHGKALSGLQRHRAAQEHRAADICLLRCTARQGKAWQGVVWIAKTQSYLGHHAPGQYLDRTGTALLRSTTRRGAA